MNNNARYDRPTDTFELEVNVPRTIGILRDDDHNHLFTSLPRSRSLSRHATLLPTNGCSHSNNIPFPLFLRSNEGANHVSAN